MDQPAVGFESDSAERPPQDTDTATQGKGKIEVNKPAVGFESDSAERPSQDTDTATQGKGV